MLIAKWLPDKWQTDFLSNDQKDVYKNDKKNHKLNTIWSSFFSGKIIWLCGSSWKGKEKSNDAYEWREPILLLFACMN